ncbi:L-2-hydroxyglutarate oxidase [Balneola sp. MJW-20]|uniref:L-2-hydroxyglutarate oxidase n=1 Tax=Gracilimonas aurantiaca TaxID=3234185 RepID=UPI003467631C
MKISSSTSRFDFIIVGAGIVGLSTAYKLSLSFPDSRLLLLEKEEGVAAHQTGKNSGVIHSGIYYKPGSYKAKNCVEGRHQLVDFCREHKVEMEVCGKVIVATSEEEIPRLEAIYERGLENGIEGIELIGEDRLKELEPHVAGIQAIHVPCSGIVDYAGMCEKLKDLIIENGGEVRFGSAVTGITDDGHEVTVRSGKKEWKTGFLITCGGLHADRLAEMAGLKSPVQIVPFKGEYYELKPEAEYLVNDLIYPLPNPDFPFLGVHFTRMALGGIECGPNAVFAFKREGYEKLSFDLKDTIETFNFPGFWKLAFKHWKMGMDEYKRSLSKSAFVKGLQKLIPAVREEHLKVSPSGVRAMALKEDGEILDDFYFMTDSRQIHVLNAPSPAATACLAIADEIVTKVKDTQAVS